MYSSLDPVSLWSEWFPRHGHLQECIYFIFFPTGNSSSYSHVTLYFVSISFFIAIDLYIVCLILGPFLMVEDTGSWRYTNQMYLILNMHILIAIWIFFPIMIKEKKKDVMFFCSPTVPCSQPTYLSDSGMYFISDVTLLVQVCFTEFWAMVPLVCRVKLWLYKHMTGQLQWWSWTNINLEFLGTTPTEWYQMTSERTLIQASSWNAKPVKVVQYGSVAAAFWPFLLGCRNTVPPLLRHSRSFL